MTEERKQELRQLLAEAMSNLDIRRHSGVGPSSLPVEVYRTLLDQSWTSYSEDLGILSFAPHIVNGITKSKLLDFIRAEFAPFIREDQIQTASFFIMGGFTSGYPLDWFLKQLLNITIVRGIEGAVLAFDRCTKDTHGSFQYLALLEGIRLEAEIQVFEGIRLVPLPHSTSELPRYLPRHPGLFLYLSDWPGRIFIEKTLLIIDASVFPIFCKPFPELYEDDFREGNSPFWVKVNDEKFSHFDEVDFYEKFCQALSLACNSTVQIALGWRSLAKDELYNLSLGIDTSQFFRRLNPVGSATEIGDTQIEEAKRLYHILIELDADVREKLQIPIDRWIKSKTGGNIVDRMIDLGIAFEALYVPDSGRGEIRFKLAVRAAWNLGKDKDDRNKLLTKFKQIYDHRSNAVHSGKLDEKVKFGGERIPISEFIKKAQDLCWESIMKVLEDRQYPNWNDLILGGEVESDIIALNEDPGGLG